MIALFGCVLIYSLLHTVQGSQECNTGNKTFVNCSYGFCPVSNSTYEKCCQKQGPNECFIGNHTFVNCSRGCCPVVNSTFEQCCQKQDPQETDNYIWIKVIGSIIPGGIIGGFIYFVYCKIRSNSKVDIKATTVTNMSLAGEPAVSGVFRGEGSPAYMDVLMAYKSSNLKSSNLRQDVTQEPDSEEVMTTEIHAIKVNDPVRDSQEKVTDCAPDHLI